jgi:hypothetical protein
MFNDRENIIGVILLGLCVVIGAVMVWAIATDAELEYTGPAWLAWLIAALFTGAVLYGLFQSFAGRRRSGGAPQWPAPGGGRRPWWKFWER